MKLFFVLTCVLIVFLNFSKIFVYTTKVNPCKQGDGTIFRMDEDKTIVSGCTDMPCPLKRNTTVWIKFVFVPDEDVQQIKNAAWAVQGGAKIPVPGVDKKSACNNIYMPDETTKVDCPLSAGQEYLYKWPIPIKLSYPKGMSAVLHYELKEKSKTYACMEVTGKIV